MRRPLPVPGICDRCGQTYKLADLKWEYVLGRSTGMRMCKSCLDPSHPQLDTRNVKTSDKQSVLNARTDYPELEAERRLFAFNPVGCEGTSTATIGIGRVSVVAVLKSAVVDAKMQTCLTGSVGTVNVGTNSIYVTSGTLPPTYVGFLDGITGLSDIGSITNIAAIPPELTKLVFFVDAFDGGGNYAISGIAFEGDVMTAMNAATFYVNGSIITKSAALYSDGRTTITYTGETFSSGSAILSIIL